MDKTVIILIGAGVCCVVIGIALFAKLVSKKSDDDDEDGTGKKLLDDEYMENFQECFENTGNIEDTLDQLAHVYTGNQYMHNLIVNAIEYIRDEQGDYETALDKINVDSDMAVMRMHDTAIKKALNLEHNEQEKESEKEDSKVQNTTFARIEKEADEDFDEDEEEESEVDESEPEEPEEQKEAPKKKLKKKRPVKKAIKEENDEDDSDEDLDGFKIG